ncbi:conserved hypothetical protein [Desulfamplus magnetovallimortis]|uniref:HD domain-containing protein n=1 Tax=Desulfamplus magnetovallimortis TaxID=1246637 RepID=A0A1W1HGV4_9BACT|nr:hypothetical protein [Desulfamplus magnetovallimortis]SLM31635.1 conserved hypothetical protein [Desulfamplus magnetovallimortis]
MNSDIYLKLREEARKIIADLPEPEFNRVFSKEITCSREMLHSDPLLIKIKKELNIFIEDDFGHGMRHSDLVCVDAGAIIQVEMGCKLDDYAFSGSGDIYKQILLVQTAGLLHDVKRKEKQHARKGAGFAKTFLSEGGYPLTAKEIDTISFAIKEHEAFQKTTDRMQSVKREPTLISNALYDADKFRWGPDNFTHTVWDMVIFLNAPLHEFVRRYPDGMAALERIKGTFRTETGKSYGSNFIEIGIEAGSRLFEIIKKQFPEAFSPL